MPLGTFAPGPYTMTYTPPTGAPGASSALNPGLVEGPRFLDQVNHSIPVDNVDAFGKTLVDEVYAGGTVKLRMTFKEWKTAVWDIMWPFYATEGATGDLGVIGRMMSDIAGQIVLTPVASTPAVTAGPSNGVCTIYKAIVAPENSREIIMGCAMRDVPIVFNCYPVLNSSRYQWYTWS